MFVILSFRMGYVGFKKGLGAELAKLFALFVGFLFTFRYFSLLALGLSHYTFFTRAWADGFVMTVLICISYFLMARGLRFLEPFVQVTFEERINRWIGLAAGLFRALIITSIFLNVCVALPSRYLDASILEQSFVGKRCVRVVPALYDAVESAAKGLYRAL